MSRIPARLRRRILAEGKGRWAYCRSGEAWLGVTFEIDPIVPESAGGRTTMGNLCLSCPTCNRGKGVRQMAPDPDTGRVVALFHPRRDRWSEPFAWSVDFTRIVGLTPTGRATVEALRMNRPHLVEVRAFWGKVGIHPPAEGEG